MSEIENARQLLANFLERGDAYEAEQLVARYGVDELQGVISRVATSGDTEARIAALELAGELGGAENCRIVLNRLDDEDQEVRDVAGSMLEICEEPRFADDLVRAYDDHDDLELRQTIALQIGTIGRDPHAAAAQRWYDDTADEGLHHSLDLALAKLGDRAALERHVARLEDDKAAVRFQALQDSIYVADPELIRHLGPALEDTRPYMAVTLPDEDPQVVARICDFAVTTMSALGAPLSFDAESVWRRNPRELEEAQSLVEAAGGAHN